MSVSISYLTKHLAPSVQVELAFELSQKLAENPENVKILYDLLDGTNLEENKHIYVNILNFFTGNIYNAENPDYEDALNYLQKLPNLRQDILKKILATLQSHIHSNINWFIPEFRTLIDLPQGEQETEEVSNELILSLIDFLEYFFVNLKESDVQDSVLDSVLLKYLGINDDSISGAISKLIRWRIDQIVSRTVETSAVWDIIFTLNKTGNKAHIGNGFILWLRYLNNEKFIVTKTFQDVLIQDDYWSILQNGLISSSHDHRKYCLSILQLSVKKINFDFSNNFIKWDTSNTNLHLKSWARFVTLFEILGIDTSLHQANAGSNDIIALISPDSLIHPSWGFCLLSTGFRASMDSVRKFSLRLLVSIPPQNLYLIKHGLSFLKDIYLPYAMLAPHYVVRSLDGINKCEFGTSMTRFVSSLISNLNTDEEYQQVVGTVLQVLEDMKESYDPARIYVSQGIADGLKNKRVLKYGQHDKILIKLFENTSEGDLFETSCQTLNLKILLNFELNVESLLQTLNTFVKFNGYKLIHHNFSLIQNYLADVKTSELFECFQKISSNECKPLLLPLLSDFESETIDYIINGPRILLVNVLQTGFRLPLLNDRRIIEYSRETLSELLYGSNTETDDELATLASVDFSELTEILPTPKDLVKTFNKIVEDLNSDDYQVLQMTSSKFALFNKMVRYVPERVFHSFNQVLSLHKSILSNAGVLTKTVKDFYKLKDIIYGRYFSLIAYCASHGLFEETDIIDVIELMNASASDFESNMSMVQTINFYVSKYSKNLKSESINQISKFLCSMWSNLDSTRLQLNQKDLHILLIDTLYHQELLSRSGFASTDLIKVSISIIENSQGRRSLLPALTRNLFAFQLKASETFESSSWIPEVLVRASILFQLRSNGFKLEGVIGKLFDEKIAISSNSNIYTSIYGPDEVSTKINLMAIFNSIRSRKFSQQILDFIINNEREFNFLTVFKATDGLEEWTRIELFRVIVSIIDKVDISDVLMETFIGLLETDPSPLVRIYIEWAIGFKLLSSKKYTDKLFNDLLTRLNSLKPSVVTSYERILFMMIQEQTEKLVEQELLSKFLTIIVPGATSNRALTRHFSLSLVVSVYNEVKLKGLQLGSHLSELIENMFQSASKSESFDQYRSGDALVWNLKKDLTLVGINGGVLLRLSDREEIELIPREFFLEFLNEEQISHLHHPVGDDFKNLWVKERKPWKDANFTTENVVQSPLQTKSGAWNTIMDVDVTARGSDIVRSDLIVVSSLVDKPPNLGGICRLSDVLGAGLLTLHDIRVKTHPQFKTVAVTADQWMPMVEVKVDEIRQFLIQKKKEGYTLIGLEQTDKSVELNSELKFPKKSLILLGKEKEGVPGDLLAELDFCVEIKQVGVIRSMNIQTATAIIVHAYSTQHC